MNTTVEIFKNEEFGQVRTVLKDDEVWFVAKDICKALELSNPTVAIQRLDTDEVTKLNLGGLVGETNLVNESGLYSLILGSRKPEARKFKKWVTSEVIPSIRKHGAYMTEQTLERALTDPDFLIQLATQLKLEQEKRKALELENKIMKPKAEYFDALVDKKLLTNFRDTAKELGIGQKKLITWLLDNGYLYRDTKKNLKAYQLYIDKGLFEYKDFVKGGFSSTQTLVTVKGKETIRLLIK